MAGIDDIIAEILKEAHGKADAILAEARAEADRIFQENENVIQSKKSLMREQTQKLAAFNSSRSMTSAQLTARNRILDAKQNVISTAFQNAVRKILQMPDDEYIKIVDSMVKKVPDSSKMKLEMIPRDAESMSGGFLLKGDNGVILNFSFKDIADSIREKIEPQVIKRLGW